MAGIPPDSGQSGLTLRTAALGPEAVIAVERRLGILLPLKLSEILERLDAFDCEATIIAAEPWTPSSRAEVIEPTEAGLVAEMARDGMVYFLEVAIAREFKVDWPSEQGKADFCGRLIQYAINDAQWAIRLRPQHE